MGAKHRTQAHKAKRAEYASVVDAGNGWCSEPTGCRYVRESGNPNDAWIQPGSEWHAAHALDGINYAGPAHAHCNESAGGEAGMRARGTALTTTRWAL